MPQSASANVQSTTEKKHWQVVIQVGAEVIRRQCTKTEENAGDAELRSLAIQTARDEGYALDEAHVTIVH